MSKIRKNQTGFSVIEVVLLLVIVGIVAFAGGYVLHAKKTNKSPTSTKTSTSKSAPDVARSVNVNGTVADDGSFSWTNLTASTIKLPEWNISMVLPASLVNKSEAAFDKLNDNYDFSLPSITNNQNCVNYFVGDQKLAFAGISLGRYASTTAASGQVGTAASSDSQTLDEYYSAHRANDGNYFVDAASGHKYWKVGSYFYIASTSPSVYSTSAFSSACPGVDGSYESLIADSLKTLK